jgi:uncharacterized membrane protein (DUF106 family)
MKKETWILFFVLFISLYIGYQWDDLDSLRTGVHAILDPSFGKLIAWNNFWGFLAITAVLAFVLTMAQKFLTDQTELKKLKAEQKAVQQEMKKYKDHPEKLLELQKETFKSMPKMMHLTMRSFTYTGVPIILFFRWFQEVLNPIYGGWWILYYLIGTMIFSGVFRKVFKTA